MYHVVGDYAHQEGAIVLGPFETREEAEAEKREMEKTPDLYRQVEVREA